MPRILTSTIPDFPGTITLPDHLDMGQLTAYEDGEQDARDLAQAEKEKPTKNALRNLDAIYLPVIAQCVVSNDIAGWGNDHFPLTPRLPSHELMAWIIRELNTMYWGELEIPNAPEPEPSPTPKEPAQAES
jgi:hypothetical protein